MKNYPDIHEKPLLRLRMADNTSKILDGLQRVESRLERWPPSRGSCWRGFMLCDECEGSKVVWYSHPFGGGLEICRKCGGIGTLYIERQNNKDLKNDVETICDNKK